MATVISGEKVHVYRLLAIKHALRLEMVGMRGKIRASVIARQILNKAGYKASWDKKNLLVEFSEYVSTILKG